MNPMIKILYRQLLREDISELGKATIKIALGVIIRDANDNNGREQTKDRVP